MNTFSRFLMSTIAIFLIAACSPTPTEEPTPDKVISPEELSFSSDDPIWGNKKAPIQMIVYSDFECPYCAEFYMTLKQLENDWITSGKLAIQYKDFPLAMHQNALAAHMATSAAEKQGKYWEFHTRLYQNQSAWSTLDDPKEFMKQLASELNLNQEKFEKDCESPEVEKEIFGDRDEGRLVGVTGTPGFTINGQLFRGAFTTDELIKELKFFDKE